MYQVYLVTKEDVIAFPLSPSFINIKINNKDKQVDLVNKGEVTILKKPGLTDINLDMRLFAEEQPFTKYPNGFKDPGWFISKLTKVKENKEYCRLIIARNNPNFDTNMLVSIKEVSIPENADNGTGFYDISLDMKSYSLFNTEVLELKQIGDRKALVKQETKRPSKDIKDLRKVLEGDTLWSIAKKELDNENDISKLMKLNNLKSPNDLKVGQELRLK